VISTERRFQFYGRRKGKSLRRHHSELMDVLLPHLRVDLADPLHGMGERRWLEIGFGGGEHLAHQAGLHGDVSFIGAEPFVNGVAKMLALVEEKKLSNVKIHDADARPLLEALPELSFERIYLLYPDPWPKARHHRRRFVTPEHLEPLARVLKPGAEFRVATDIPDYVRQTLEEVPRHGFDWLAEGPQDWRRPWDDWLSTRYEQKALREGRVPHYLTFRRR
jgi:tRNA (guanine-N7-)-methyltransferase